MNQQGHGNSRDLAEYVSKLEEADVNIEDNFSEDNLVEQIEDFKITKVKIPRTLHAHLTYDVFCTYVSTFSTSFLSRSHKLFFGLFFRTEEV